jgi:hypothetical protein
MVTGTKEPRRLLFIEIGETLYGDRWKKAMATALGCDHRTIKRWVAGEFRIPDEAFEALIPIMKLHINACRNLLGEMK